MVTRFCESRFSPLESRKVLAMSSSHLNVTLDAVIVAVSAETPRLLTVGDALPSGSLDVVEDATLEKGMRRVVGEQAGIELGYVEQLYTFGDLKRDPSASAGGPRHLSVAYLGLVEEERPLPGAAWSDWYELLPWEDRRANDAYVEEHLALFLHDWVGQACLLYTSPSPRDGLLS